VVHCACSSSMFSQGLNFVTFSTFLYLNCRWSSHLTTILLCLKQFMMKMLKIQDDGDDDDDDDDDNNNDNNNYNITMSISSLVWSIVPGGKVLRDKLTIHRWYCNAATAFVIVANLGAILKCMYIYVHFPLQWVGLGNMCCKKDVLCLGVTLDVFRECLSSAYKILPKLIRSYTQAKPHLVFMTKNGHGCQCLAFIPCPVFTKTLSTSTKD